MIIGITGPSGAGKDTAAEYFAQSLDIPHVSGGDALRGMLRAAGLEPKKSAIGDFGTFIRKHYGADAILEHVLTVAADSPHVIISGFRSPLEARLIHERGGIVVYIDAPADVRFDRISERKRGDESFTRSSFDLLDAQEFGSGDSDGENLTAVKEIADTIIANVDGMDALHAALDALARDTLKS